MLIGSFFPQLLNVRALRSVVSVVYLAFALTAAAESDSLPVTTEHVGTFNGVKVEYVAAVEAIVIDDPPVRFVTTSYIRKRGAKDRPVLFLFNGGPSVSSMTLHIVGLGPKRIAVAQDVTQPPPPPQLLDNSYTVLDVADLVFIDPAETGFSRVLDPQARERVYSVFGDADSVAKLIEAWSRKHGREGAPKFVLGESYGTIRAALVAERLAKTMPLEGVYLFGQAVNIVETTQRAKNIVSYPTNLPSLAAIAAYHGKADLGGRSIEQFIDDVYAWGMTEYLNALLKGNDLPASDRQRIAKQLQDLTGISAEYYFANELKITKVAFARELLRDRNRIVAQYDARYSGPAPASGERAADPFFAAVASQEPLFAVYLEKALGVKNVKEYRASAPDTGNWKWEATGGMVGGPFLDYDYQAALDKAFEANPRFRLAIGTGIYDLTTTIGPARYLVAQSRYPRDRVSLHQYEGGHMAYTNETALAKFAADVRALIVGTNSKRTP
jgi:carboxypeptidase C (cathepsin A)